MPSNHPRRFLNSKMRSERMLSKYLNNFQACIMRLTTVSVLQFKGCGFDDGLHILMSLLTCKLQHPLCLQCDDQLLLSRNQKIFKT